MKPAVAAAPLQVDTRRRNKRDQINAMILIIEEDGQKQRNQEIVKIRVSNQRKVTGDNNKKNKKGKNNRNDAQRPSNRA